MPVCLTPTINNFLFDQPYNYGIVRTGDPASFPGNCPQNISFINICGRGAVRETPAWKKHAADLEAEMLGRGMVFDSIEWLEDR